MVTTYHPLTLRWEAPQPPSSCTGSAGSREAEPQEPLPLWGVSKLQPYDMPVTFGRGPVDCLFRPWLGSCVGRTLCAGYGADGVYNGAQYWKVDALSVVAMEVARECQHAKLI